ncbi:MAG: hypothetical protein ACI9J3_001920 [Parvicellaceae bacterium]|jgi:hypothetical protein
MTQIDLSIQTFMDWSFEEQFNYIFHDSAGIGFKHPQVKEWSDDNDEYLYELYLVDGFYVTVQKDLDNELQVLSFSICHLHELN